jgi:hypothetical protein
MTPSRGRFLIFRVFRLMEEAIGAVVTVLRSGWLGTEFRVAAFEEALAGCIGVLFAVAMGSRMAVLYSAPHPLEVGPEECDDPHSQALRCRCPPDRAYEGAAGLHRCGPAHGQPRSGGDPHSLDRSHKSHYSGLVRERSCEREIFPELFPCGTCEC